MAEHISAGDNQVPLSASTTSSTAANTASAGPKATQRYVFLLYEIIFLLHRWCFSIPLPLCISLSPSPSPSLSRHIYLYHSVRIGSVARARGLPPIVHFTPSTRHERLFRSPISARRRFESSLLLHLLTNERIHIFGPKINTSSTTPPLRYMGYNLYHRPNSGSSPTDDDIGIRFSTWNRFHLVNGLLRNCPSNLSPASVNHFGESGRRRLAAWHR